METVVPPGIPNSIVSMGSIERRHIELFKSEEKKPTETWNDVIFKMVTPEEREDQHTDMGVQFGEKPHPFNMAAAIQFKNQNEHHSTCIETKARSLCGLGFVNDKKISKELDFLCDETFQSSVLNPCGEDFWQVGNAYIEVVRKGRRIVGLHHVPAASVRICIHDKDMTKLFVVQGELGIAPKLVASFGELDEVLKKFRKKTTKRQQKETGEQWRTVFSSWARLSERSEIIHLRRATSMDHWYGYPDWLSAIATVELEQMMTQERFDFFLNRGVPEFILFLLGREVSKPDKDKIEAGLQATVGPGNNHKSMVVNFADETMKVQLEKLAIEGKSDADYSKMSETNALKIVTAHRTPPVLAGITIPGKLGATNELPNALMAFQTLVIGPEQHTIKSILGATLGSTKTNGGLKVRPEDFEFKKITDEIPAGLGQQEPGANPGEGGSTSNLAKPAKGLKRMDTASRMRTPLASAKGRNLDRGVKK